MVWAFTVILLLSSLSFHLSEIIVFARYIPITHALPVTSETCPLPLDYSICDYLAMCIWLVLPSPSDLFPVLYTQKLFICLGTFFTVNKICWKLSIHFSTEKETLFDFELHIYQHLFPQHYHQTFLTAHVSDPNKFKSTYKHQRAFMMTNAILTVVLTPLVFNSRYHQLNYNYNPSLGHKLPVNFT